MQLLQTILRLRLFNYKASGDVNLLKALKQSTSAKSNLHKFNGQETVNIEYGGVITRYADKEKYEQAKHRLLCKGEYLPPWVCSIVSDFTVANRTAQPGDYILQRVNVFPQPQLTGLLEVLALDQVAEIKEEEIKLPEKKTVLTFVIHTTSYHDEIGQHTVIMEWFHQRKLLIWKSQSMSMLLLPWPLSVYGRYLQREAHKQAQRYMENYCH